MGIFTRFRDIVSANLNAMLDRAEDPEKLVKLMIREMEDTLIELKAACAGVMASRRKVQRRLEEAREREALWDDRARLAVEKGRDGLAREALVEKRRFSETALALGKELGELQELVEQYQDDMGQLEDKLTKAREKQRLLVQRHIRARRSRKAREEIRRMENHEAMAKFDDLENRIERMEAEAELVDHGRKPTLEEAFEKLEDDDIEQELANLKAERDRKASAGE
jgi:phage shock protein A